MEGLELGESPWGVFQGTHYIFLSEYGGDPDLNQMSMMRGNNNSIRQEKQNLLCLRELIKMGNVKCIDYLKKYIHSDAFCCYSQPLHVLNL